MKFMDKHGRNLADYLAQFGKVSMLEPDFSGLEGNSLDELNYAGYEVILPEKVEGPLEKEIKKKFNERDEIGCKVNIVSWGSEVLNGHKYVFELIVKPYIQRNIRAYEDATKSSIKSLSKFLKDYKYHRANKK